MSDSPASPAGRPLREGDRPAAASGSGIDPVDAEWAMIEQERLAEEVAEAREDAIEAIVDPVNRRRTWGWMWWAFAVALVSGAVFAGWVDLVVATNRPAPEPPPFPAATSPLSPSELGEDAAGDGEPDAEASDQAAGRRPEPGEPSGR